MKLRMPSPDLVRRGLAGHAALGLLAGALMFILAISGTLIVVHEEWQRWEQPNVPEVTAIDHAAVQRAAETVLASEAGKPETEHFYIHLPNDALPRFVVTTDNQAVYADSEGNVVALEAHGWTEFLIGLHYYFHLPAILGLTIVGGFGVMLAALAITGVIAHPRIFRDAFRLRARGNRQLAQTDWHNRIGVWTLPFSVALAITGALLGLATVLAYSMASVYYDDNIVAVYEPVFGEDARHDERPMPLADIAGALDHMARAYPDVRASFVIMHEPGTAGQKLQIMADHPRRLIFGEYYNYDARGNFTGTTGLADGEIGQQLAASTYKLHFGNFGGLPIKLAYIAFGIALAVVSATGMSIWLMKRRQRGRASPRLEGFWSAVVWGTGPLIAIAYLARVAFGPEAPMVAIFWIGLALLTLAAMVAAREEATARVLRALTGVLLTVIAMGHMLALENWATAIVTIDLVLLAMGLGFLVEPLRRLAGGRAAGPAALPAE